MLFEGSGQSAPKTPNFAFERMAFLMFLLCGLLYGLFRYEQMPHLFHHSDKVGHLGAFFVLVMTLRWAIPSSVCLWRLLVPVLCFALGSEYIQGSGWLPERHFSYMDMLANGMGIAVAVLLIFLSRYLPDRLRFGR